MVHLAQAKVSSRHADGIECPPTPDVNEQASMPMTSLEDCGKLREKYHFSRKPVNLDNNPDVSPAQPRRHRRNKTTISNISEIMTSPFDRDITLPTPSAPQGIASMAMSTPEDNLRWVEDKLFASPETAHKFIVQRVPILSDQHHEDIPPIPDTMSIYQSGDDQKRSSFNGDAPPKHGHVRTNSGSSIDSDYASTVADDSWNPVDDYIASNSSDEEPDLSNAVSLFDMKSAYGRHRKSVSEVYENPEQMTENQTRLLYPLGDHELAKLQHGTVVRDAAYVAGEPPGSEEEWENVQLAPRYERIDSPPDNLSLADIIDMNAGIESEEEQPAPMREPEVYRGPGLTSADFTNMLPNKVEEWFEDTEEAAVSQERLSSPTGEVLLLPSTVYKAPTARLIAEDVSSTLDDANGSGSDGDDELSHRIPRKPLPQARHNTEPSNATSRDREGSAMDRDLNRNDGSHPADPPIKLRKHRRNDGEDQRSGSASMLRRISAHVPGLDGSRREPKEKCTLDRSFQFPSRDGETQRLVSEPLLGGGHTVPVNEPKRAGSFRRVINKVKGNDSFKKANNNATPRPSLLRRAVKRVNGYLDRHDL